MRITLTHKTRINGFVGILVIIGTLSPFPHLQMSILTFSSKFTTPRYPKWHQHWVVFSKNQDENDYQVNHPLWFPWFLGGNSKVIYAFIQRQF